MEDLLARLAARTPPPPLLVGLRRELAWWSKGYVEYLRMDGARPRPTPSPGAQTYSVARPDQETSEGAEVLRALGDRAGARARLGNLPARLRARRVLDPSATQLLRAAAVVGAVLGNTEEALRRIAPAGEMIPEAGNFFMDVSIGEVRASVYARTGDKDRAIDEMARRRADATGGRRGSAAGLPVIRNLPQRHRWESPCSVAGIFPPRSECRKSRMRPGPGR